MARKASGRLVSIRRRSRAGLLRSTALQAAVLVAIELPGGILRPAAAQPAPNARPQGGRVTAGQASISQSPTTTTIDQSSQRAAINWNSFDVGRNQAVDFQQPSSSAWTLNRVISPDPSQIAGRIQANGNIVLTNPSGVVFYRGSEVNAQSVVISAPGITDRNFMRGRMVFDQLAHPNARIVNAGSITIKQAGLAALVAPQVVNSGVITAKLGHVLLAGATTHTLDMYGDGLLSFDVTGQVRQAPRGPDGKPATALVTNTGTILADGGSVQLSARAVDGVVQDLVDARGRIETNTVGSQTGNIVIDGTGGSIKIAGDVSANGLAPTAQGGQIELNATRNVVVGRSAVVEASGGGGGGTVAVGTTLARASGGPSVTRTRTAARALVRPGATISADATVAGNGGKVTVLSKRATAMRGTITAQGGPLRGDGGEVEVSGEQRFALTGRVNVANRGAGRSGTILLDPTNLTVIAGAAGAGNADGAVGSGGGTLGVGQPPDQANVTNGELNSLTGNIVLQASNDLGVNASFTGTSNVDLRAGHQLTVAAGTTITGDNVLLHGGEIFSTGSASGNGGVVVDGVVNAFGTFGSPGHGTIEIAGGSLGIAVNGALSGTNEILLVATGGSVQLGASSQLSTNLLDVSTLQSGSFTQAGTNTSSIFANTLQSSQGVVGDVSLTSTNNVIFTIGNFPAGGSQSIASFINTSPVSVTGTVTSGSSVSLNVGGPLTISGVINAPTISLHATQFGLTSGDITQTAGSIVGSSSVVLIADGSISQTGGVIIAGTLSGSSGNNILAPGTGNTTLNSPGNSIGNLGNFTSVGGFTLTDGTALTASGVITDSTSIGLNVSGALGLSGTLTAPFMSLVATGNITQTGGVIVVNTELTGSSGGTTSLNSAGNTVAVLGSFTSTDDFRLTSSTLTLSQPAVSVGTGHTIDLTTDTLNFAGSDIPGPVLTAPSGTVILEPLTLNRPVDLGSAGGSGTLDILPSNLSRIIAGTLQIGSTRAGPVNIGDTTTFGIDTIDLVNLTNLISTLNVQSGGSITEGGVLVVGTLSGSAGGSVFLSRSSNTIDTLGSFTVAGDFSLTDAQALMVTGPIDPTNVTLNAPSLTIAGLVSASGTVDVIATTGSISEPGGTIDTSVLTGSAATSISLTSTSNVIGTVDGLSAFAGNLSLTDSSDLVIFGAPSVGGALSGTTVDLVVSGTISEAGTGQILATDLIGSAGQANLIAPTVTNLVAGLGGFTTTNGFTLVDGEALSVTGPVNAGTGIALTAAGGLTASGIIAAPTIDLTAVASRRPPLPGDILQTGGIIDGSTSLVLTAAGSIDQSGGTLTAGTLSGSSGGRTNLPRSANAVTNLGTFSSVGGFTLAEGQALAVAGPVTDTTNITITGAGALSASGDVTAPTIALRTTAGSITQTAGSIDGSTNVALIAAGSIDQSGGSIVAGTLNGSSGGATSLSSTGNQVANLGIFASSGDFTLADSQAVTFAGAASAGGSGEALTIIDNNFSIGAGALAAPSGTIVLEPLTAGTAFRLTGTPGALPFTANTLVLGSLTAGAVTISNDVNLSGVNVLDVLSAASISEASGTVLAVGTLEGKAGTSANFAATNSVTTLGSFTSNSGFLLTDTRSLTVTGPVTDLTGATFNVTGDLTLTGNLTAPTVQVSASGAFAESGGSITTGSLSGSAGSVALGTPSNAIATLDGFTTSGDFALADAPQLTVAGPLSSPGAIQLSAGGGLVVANTIAGAAVNLQLADVLVETGTGQVQTAVLTGSVASATLTGGNAIASLGDFAAPGELALTNTEDLTIAGAVNGGRAVALTVRGGLTLGTGTLSSTGRMALNTSGAITDQSGSIAAGTLTGSASGLAQFGRTSPNATASIGTLAAFKVNAGTLALADSVPLTITGPLSADDIGVSARGSIVLVGGTIATLGLPVAQQLGGQPAGPGSFFQVLAGPDGTGQFLQLGVTTIDPPNGIVPTLRIQVPDAGGSIVLNDLVGPTANVVLATRSGSMNGTIDVASLNVIGTAGNANLFGTVAGIGGQAAAPISNITPAINNNYLLNLCVIMSPACGPPGLIGENPPGLTGENPQLLVPPNTLGRGFLPGEDEIAVDPANSEAAVLLGLGRPPIAGVARECYSVGSLDTLTSDCLDLILPNISDRDY